MLNPFIEYPGEFTETPFLGGEHWTFNFPNGYGASVSKVVMATSPVCGNWPCWTTLATWFMIHQ